MSKKRHQRPEKTKFEIDSIAALNEYLTFAPQKILNVELKSENKALIDRLRSHDIAHQIVGGLPRPVRATVGEKTRDASHLDTNRDVIVALDHISDPRNLGAIVRSAGFFGIKQLVIPRDRQVSITDAAVATAQGGFAYCDIIEVVNLSRTLRELKDHSYWVLGADMEGQPASSFSGQFEKLVLVLGAEGSGLSSGVKKHCDACVGIPGAKEGLESLNVSVAAGILMSVFC